MYSISVLAHLLPMVIYVIAINLHCGRCGFDCMIVGFITTCAIIAYHH